MTFQLRCSIWSSTQICVLYRIDRVVTNNRPVTAVMQVSSNMPYGGDYLQNIRILSKTS